MHKGISLLVAFLHGAVGRRWPCVTSSPGTTECLNPHTFSWQPLPTLDVGSDYAVGALSFGGMVSCLVGGTTATTRFYCANSSALVSNSGQYSGWNAMPNLPQGMTSPITFVGKGWVAMAGCSTGCTTSTWNSAGVSSISSQNGVFLPPQVSWTGYTSGIQGSSGAFVNGTPCIFGGATLFLASTVTTCLSGDLSSLAGSSAPAPSWVSGPGLTTSRMEAAALEIGGVTCVAGGMGYIGFGTISTTECLSTAGTFTVMPAYSLPATVANIVNVTINGMPCVAGGGTNTVWCGNYTRTSFSWLPYPSLTTARTSPVSFFLDEASPTPSPTSMPTRSPTLAPVPAPTLARTSSPTAPTTSPIISPTTYPTPVLTNSPTLSPTTNDGQQWSVDYAEVFFGSQWATFSIVEPVLSSFTISWDFPSLSNSISHGLILNTSQAQIPPFAFLSPNFNNFSLEIRNSNAEVIFSLTANFDVLWSPLSIRVNGGDRDVPANTHLSLVAQLIDSTSIIATSSQTAKITLIYSWSVLPPCTAQTRSVVGGNFSLITPSQNQICVVKLAASDTLGRNAVVQATLKVKVNLRFSVEISGDFQIPFPITSTLRLLGTIYPVSGDTSGTYSYSWAVAPSLSLQCASAVSMVDRALIIPPFCFSGLANYSLYFNATSSARNQASAWVSISTNVNPAGGSCTVDPLNGTALTTPFTVNCSAWTQELTSLSYMLQRKTISSIGDNIEIAESMLQNIPIFSNLYFPLLNPGLQAEEVNLIVYVSTQLGSVSSILLPAITLRPPTITICPVVNGSNAQNIQYLTALVSGLRSPRTVTMNACTFAQRQAIWNALWNLVQQFSRLTYIDASTVEVMCAAFEALLKATPPSSNDAIPPNNFVASLGQVLLVMLESPEVTVNSTVALLGVVDLASLILVTDCNLLNKVVTALALRVQQTTSTALPGEIPLVLSQSGLSITSGTYFGDSSGSLDASSVSLSLPTQLLSQGGDVSRVVVTNYPSSLVACRGSSGTNRLVGPVVDITLTGQESSAVQVSQVSGGFAFMLPYTNDAACGRSQCVWWDASSTPSKWRPDGCTGEETADKSGMLCKCTHLTEFSLLLNPGCVSKTYTALYLTLLAMYSILVAVVLVKLIHRFVRCRKGSTGATSVVLQHVLILILGSTRIAGCYTLSSSSLVQKLTIPSRAAILLLPYLLMFWIYTLMVFQWAALYHFGMKHQQTFSKVRGLFATSNLLVSGALVAVIIAITNSISDDSIEPSTSDDTLVQIAGFVIAGVTGITAIAFFVYAGAVYKSLGGGTERSSVPKHEGGCSSCFNLQLRTKIMMGGTVVCAMLCVESVLHIVSTAALTSSSTAPLQGDGSEVGTMVAELVCLWTLIAMYHRAMMNDERRHSERPKKQQLSGPMTSKTVSMHRMG